jgi:hypothetical protein
MKARRLGLRDGDALVALAVQRGCGHYLPYVQSVNAHAPLVDERELSNEELAAALLLGNWPYQPVMLRAAAQLMADESSRPAQLAQLAVRERCSQAMRYIAEAGASTEPDNRFWRTLLNVLPSRFSPPLASGTMPHPSRFRSETGIVDPRHPTTPKIRWLRPSIRQ